MNKILLMALTAGMMAGPALAADDPDNQGAAEETMAPGMMMGMMNHEQMMRMQEHMQEMQQLMADIQAESDPDRRQALLEAHRAKMDEAMGMMGGAMMGHTGGGNMREMDMAERMQMMQNQMGMMGMMMQQMMEHFSTGEGHLEE